MPPLNVFIVEDSATIRQNLADTLEECAPVHVVGYADRADDAIDRLLASDEPCDLAIVDVLLRQGSGVEVLRALKRHDCRFKRVVLTNYATPLLREHCLDLGADRVFDKSGEVDSLLEYCGALAALRR